LMSALAVNRTGSGPMVLGVVLLFLCGTSFAQSMPWRGPPPMPGAGYVPAPLPFLPYPGYVGPWQYGREFSTGYGPRAMMRWEWRDPRGAGPDSRVVDTNADGIISEPEAMAQYDEVFVDMDSNADGAITEAEYRAGASRPRDARPGLYRPQPQPVTKGASNCFQRMDQDDNKKVQREEFRVAARQQFWASDLNRDGTVTVQEFWARNR
jgi:hypothetical protein